MPVLAMAGRVLALGAHCVALPDPNAITPASVGGLASWWDAGRPPTGGTAITTLADRAGTTPLAASAAAAWLPRLAGALGGAGLEVTQQQGYQLDAWAPTLHPLLDPALAWSAGVAFGSGGAATIDLVWTRPNLRQALVNAGANPHMSATFVGGVSPLLTIGGTPVLSMTDTGAGDTLLLFPGAAQTALATSIEPRHTHTLRLRGSHVAGWDVFLDGSKLTASPATSRLASQPTTALVQMLAGAQCWLHEAFCYPRALTDAECAVLDAYLARWPRGARKGAILMAVGQSNCGYMMDGTNSMRAVSRGMTYLSGLASVTVLAQLSGSGITVLGGHGLIGGDDNYLNAALTDDPATVPLGLTGPGVYMRDLIRSMPAWAQADVCGLLAYYSENDAGLAWSQRAAFAGMVSRFNLLARGFPQAGPTRDATNWLNAWNSDIPFGGGEGHAAHKAAIKLVVDDPAQNGVLWLLNGTGVIQNGGTFDPATGINSGGDGLHVDSTIDDPRHALFGVEVLARRLAAIGRGEVAIPTRLPVRGGPAVASITWEGGAVSGNAATPTVLVTVAHDAGNDLVVPLLAVTGLGWVLLDGPVNGNTPRILGTSCTRLTSTTLRVRFASAPTQALPNVALYYIYFEDSQPRANNPGSPGRGNLVTDNYGDTVTIPAAPGFDIGNDLGPLYRVDRPLAASAVGIPLV